MSKSGGYSFLRRGSLLAVLTTTILAGCGGGGGGSSASAPAAGVQAGPNVPGNTAPSIKGAIIETASVGSTYVLAPEAGDPDGDALAFSIKNKPVWANFDTTTGRLSGTPTAEHIGAYKDVTIAVSDGKTQAGLPPFSITVAYAALQHRGVELTWTIPATTTSGETLNDLKGYRIIYGTSQQEMTQTIDLDNPGLNIYAVQGLAPGAYYFAVRAVTAAGAESDLSNIVSVNVNG